MTRSATPVTSMTTSSEYAQGNDFIEKCHAPDTNYHSNLSVQALEGRMDVPAIKSLSLLRGMVIFPKLNDLNWQRPICIVQHVFL